MANGYASLSQSTNLNHETNLFLTYSGVSFLSLHLNKVIYNKRFINFISNLKNTKASLLRSNKSGEPIKHTDTTCYNGRKDKLTSCDLVLWWSLIPSTLPYLGNNFMRTSFLSFIKILPGLSLFKITAQFLSSCVKLSFCSLVQFYRTMV